MSHQDVGTTGNASQTRQGGSRRRFLAGTLTGGLLGSLLAGGISLYAHAHPGLGWWSHGGHRGWHHQHATDAAGMSERLEFATDWFMQRLDATAEQRQQVQTVVRGAVQDLAPLREQHQAHRQAFLEALQQPSIDRNTLEALRQAELQLAETASSRFLNALADIADILTPAQRAELLTLAQRFHH
jgi:Spy/CpxP family protein refolding chaperone